MKDHGSIKMTVIPPEHALQLLCSTLPEDYRESLKTCIVEKNLHGACRLLRKHSRNRGISSSRVKRLMRTIRKHWRSRVSIIGIHQNGSLADGQHRLLAAALLKRPLKTYVLRGLTDRDVREMDDVRPRSAGDQLRYAHPSSTNNNAVTAAARMLYILCRGERPTRTEVLETVYRHEPNIRWAVDVFSARRETNIAAMHACFVLARPIDPPKIAELAEQMAEMVGRTRGCVANAIEKALVGPDRATVRGGGDLTLVHKLMRGIQLHVEGVREVVKLQPTLEGTIWCATRRGDDAMVQLYTKSEHVTEDAKDEAA